MGVFFLTRQYEIYSLLARMHVWKTHERCGGEVFPLEQ
jgi:hypothetical protein